MSARRRRRGSIGVALQNLLRWSEDLTNAVWNKGNIVIVSNAVMAPDGNVTADEMPVGPGGGSMWQGFVSVPGKTYTYSAYFMNKAGGTNARIAIYDQTNDFFLLSSPFSIFGLINNVNFVRLAYSFVAPAGCIAMRVYPSSSLDGSDFYSWGHQVNEGAAALAYAKTTASIIP